MDLGAFLSPSSSFIDTYKGASFNKYNFVIGADSTSGVAVPYVTEEDVDTVLRLCGEKGIAVQIQTHGSLIRSGYNVFTESFPKINFSDKEAYPTFTGFFLIDEPSMGQLDVLEQIYVPWFNSKYADTDLEFYCNLFGSYSTAISHVLDENGNAIYDYVEDSVNGEFSYEFSFTQMKYVWKNKGVGKGTHVRVDCLDPVKREATYQKYLQKFNGILDSVNSSNKHFTIDTYPLIDNYKGYVIIPSEEYRSIYVDRYKIPEDKILIATDLPEDYQAYVGESWLYMTNKAAINAKNNNVKFGAYILSCDEGGEKSFRYPTTSADLKWQAYINIACGAKRLMYYAYDHYIGGIYMTQNGSPLPLYYLVKETNEEIQRFDHVLSAFSTWNGIKTYLGTGVTENAAFSKLGDMELSSLAKISSLTTSNDLVVGEMVDGDGNYGYMFVGYDDPFYKHTTTISATFDYAEGFIVYRNGYRTLVDVSDGNKLELSLSAGEGVFVIPVYSTM